MKANALATLEVLILAAERVCHKHGCTDDGDPLDWKEWQALRRACARSREALQREGRDLEKFHVP